MLTPINDFREIERVRPSLTAFHHSSSFSCTRGRIDIQVFEFGKMETGKDKFCH
jgi:hypothetical protein